MRSESTKRDSLVVTTLRFTHNQKPMHQQSNQRICS